MSKHSVVFNMRVQLPGGPKDTPAQISYEQMMNTFDRTRADGVREGWVAALKALREVVEPEGRPSSDKLDDWITLAARSKHCPDFS